MKILIMHGSYGSPDENWFRWLETSAKKLGHEVILDQYPVDDWNDIDTNHPIQSLKVWETFFIKNTLPKIKTGPITFIGHSIAPIFMLRMVQKYDFQLEKAIFVAPFFDIPDRPEISKFYPVNKTFYSYDFDFEKINKQIGKSFVVYGDDDPYVPQTEPPLFAKKLGSEIYVVPGGKHCGSNFKEFPLILDLLKK